MSVLREKIEAAGASGRKALVPYLPFGFPTRERFWAEVEASSRERLEGILEALLRADRLLKTANENPARILENFLIEAEGA